MLCRTFTLLSLYFSTMWKGVDALSRGAQTQMLQTRLREATHWHYMPKAHGKDWEKQAANLHEINRLVKVEMDSFTATIANLEAKPGKGTEGEQDKAEGAGDGKAAADDDADDDGDGAEDDKPESGKSRVKRKYEKNPHSKHWSRGGGKAATSRKRNISMVTQSGAPPPGPGFSGHGGSADSPIDVAALSASLLGSMRKQGLVQQEQDATSIHTTVSEMESRVAETERGLMQVVLSP